MLTFTTGDILKSEAQAIVNTVNCVGVMGRGIALQFKAAYPANFKAYEAACRRQEVQPGRMFVFETGDLTNPQYIINFPTKRHWRGNSRIEDIDSGLRALVLELRTRGIRSVAIPPLGSGLGGLVWNEVKPRIVAALAEVPEIAVAIYEPIGADQRPTAQAAKAPAMTPGRAALVLLMEGYLQGLMDPDISLLEVHKLMYFMQEAGQGLRLQYAKAAYGPYAENLTHFLRAVEGYFVSGYADGGDNPEKTLHLVPGAAADAQAFLAQDSETRGRFDRVLGLVQGWETPFGLELLSTVHWVATREGAASAEMAVRHTHAWSDRKRRFSPEQISLAWNQLRSLGWIGLAATEVTP